MAEQDVLMLGVSGMRGVVGTTLTPSVVAGFAGAIGARARAGVKRGPARVLLGADGRAGYGAFFAAAQAGLLAAGCDVVDAGVLMTPTAGFLVDTLGCAGGVVITASHNPQNWNGVKPIVRPAGLRAGRVGASAPDKASAEAIIASYKSGSASLAGWSELGRVVAPMPGAASAHPRRVVDLLEDLGALSKIRRAGLRVALDQVSPAGTEATAELLDRLKVRVVGPGNKLQGGVFPHAPEPTADNLRAFGPRVRRHGADMGFAQDPDCDRLAIVDERGRYIGEEYTLVLAARALGELGGLRRGANIAVNLSTSRMIDDVAARFGARVVRTPVGEANVVAGMREGGSVIGGEGNGGVIWAGVTYIRDSLSAIGLALALRALGKKPLSALVGEMPSYAIVKRKVDLARKEDAAPAVRALGKAFADQKVDVQDGVRIDWLDRGAWVHVRASNTEPIMRLIAEAPDAAQANALLDQAAKVIARG